MLENLSTAFVISVIGMSLVLGSILLLWVVLTGLMRLTAGHAGSAVPAGAAEPEQELLELKRRAAVAAVAIALAQEEEFEPQLFPLPPTALVSAWQAVRRADQLEQRGSVR